MPIPTLLLAAKDAEAQAMAEPDFDRRMRRQRRMMALPRRAEGLGAEVRRHRREPAARDLPHALPFARGYDLDALEAVWWEPEREAPKTTLVALPPAVLAARYGIPMDPPGAEAAVEVPVETEPDGRLQDRDACEVEPPPRFQGVPKWKVVGRQFVDVLTEEELVEARLVRGETIEEPPRRPEEWTGP
jgi:hypothetical protein